MNPGMISYKRIATAISVGEWWRLIALKVE